MVLSVKDERLLDMHFKVHLQRLLRLHQAITAPVVFFLSGCLPISAQLHLRMFSVLGQLCRLRGGDNILAKHFSPSSLLHLPPPSLGFGGLGSFACIPLHGSLHSQPKCKSKVEVPSSCTLLPEVTQDRVPGPDSLPHHVQVLQGQTMVGGEGDDPGQAPVRKIQA